MKENKRMIGDVSKVLGVPKHTIRTWENELQLNIPRDEKGYRYYGEREMFILKKICEMKRHGMIPAEIQKEIPQNVIPFSKGKKPDNINDKMYQVQNVVTKMMGQALNEQKDMITNEISDRVVNQLTKEMNYQFRIREEVEERRFQKIDELIRIQQKTREEIAATKERKGWFHRKKE